jgi:invasion protein IalB
MFMDFARLLRPSLVTAALLLAAPGVVLAQGQAEGDANLPVLGGGKAASPPSWISACQGTARTAELDCQMEQRAVISGSGQLVGSITVRVPAQTRKPVLMIRGPLGLSLAGGVTIDVDGAGGQVLPLQTCDNGGCYAGAPVSDEMLAAMFKGQIFNVTFQNLNQEPIKLPMSLAGFSATYGKIK